MTESWFDAASASIHRPQNLAPGRRSGCFFRRSWSCPPSKWRRFRSRMSGTFRLIQVTGKATIQCLTGSCDVLNGRIVLAASGRVRFHFRATSDCEHLPHKMEYPALFHQLSRKDAGIMLNRLRCWKPAHLMHSIEGHSSATWVSVPHLF
jgi:hypothetical protein